MCCPRLTSSASRGARGSSMFCSVDINGSWVPLEDCEREGTEYVCALDLLNSSSPERNIALILSLGVGQLEVGIVKRSPMPIFRCHLNFPDKLVFWF